MSTPPTTVGIPSLSALKRHLGGPPGLRVTIAVPVPDSPSFPEIKRFPATVASAVDAADARMAALGIERGPRARVLAPLGTWRPELASLPPGSRSLVVLLGPGDVGAFSSDETSEARVVVGRSHHVRPLIAAAARGLRYRVVALSTHRVDLYVGDTRALRRVEVEGVPGSLREALGGELTERTLQAHSSDAGGEGPIFHGHGGAGRGREVDRLRFHRVLAAALRREWGDVEESLVLVADRAHAGRFRKVLELPELVTEVVSTNPQGLSEDELHALTSAVVLDRGRERRRAAGKAASEALAHGRGTEDLDRAVQVAIAGRVGRLVVDGAARRAGHLDASAGALVDPLGDEDAYEELCTAVLLRGGEVVVLEAGEAQQLGLPPLLAELRGQDRPGAARGPDQP